MIKGSSLSTFGWLGGSACLLGLTFIGSACGDRDSLGEVTGGTAGTGGGDPGTGAVSTGSVSTGATSSGSAPGAGGAPTGGAGNDIGDPRDYALEGIGGYYSPASQSAAPGKLDLLLVVDNSISMADKQQLLAAAVPNLVGRLINPRCVDAAGQPVADQPRDGLAACPGGSTRELAPVDDLHVGVISSSLGGHGGVICSPALGENFDPTADDRGELIAPRRALTSYEDQGFLKWDPRGQASPAGMADASDFLAAVQQHVTSAGESGCGYEATLESWYRFLVDPEPPAEVVSDGGVSLKQGTNTTLLDQRAAFLRPDSAVAIVLLSDENDCSMRDGGYSWLLGDQSQRVPRGTEACLTDPNSPCCRSCALAEDAPPAGCSALWEDPHCRLGPYSVSEEPLNLRCWEQSRRFGIDFLYDTDRYVRALTHDTVFRDSDGVEVPNPLFVGGQRDPSMVTFVGIVGVPWQALARSTVAGVPLRYKPAAQLHREGAWEALVGEPKAFVPPTDPFMVESPFPRTGTSPLTGLSPLETTSAAGASPVNGHEFTIPGVDDLQYACTFPLTTPRDCSTYEGGCDCKTIVGGSPDRPLCQAPGATSIGTTQYYAKAYPGLRHLEVMRRVGALAVPASICPRVIDEDSPEFGYAPVVEAMIDRLGQTLE